MEQVAEHHQVVGAARVDNLRQPRERCLRRPIGHRYAGGTKALGLAQVHVGDEHGTRCRPVHRPFGEQSHPLARQVHVHGCLPLLPAVAGSIRVAHAGDSSYDPRMTIHLDDTQVRRLLTLDALLPAMRRALIDLSAGRVVQPLRTVMDMPAVDGMLFLKPALTADALATKLITLVPGNPAKGLPTLLATIVLMDPATGQTLAVMDGTWITELRTAAVSAIAADALTAPGPKVVAMLGSGALARSHALALRAIRPVSEVRIWSRDPGNVARCAQEIGGIGCATAEEAVRGADIVCTVTNASEPVLRGAWLKPGAFVAAVGAPRPTWRELDDACMRHPVIADSRESALHEAGDVILSGATVHAELGEILAGTVAAPPAGSTVIFKSLGQAVEDAVAARLVYDAAVSAGVIAAGAGIAGTGIDAGSAGAAAEKTPRRS
jgi:ornithine cyclodeaminase